VVQLRFKGCDVATYLFTADPPLDAGADQRTLTEAVLAIACTDRGAVGRDGDALATATGIDIINVSAVSTAPATSS